MANKTLVISIDVGQYKHDWEVSAMCSMIGDYFGANKIFDDDCNVVIWPLKGEMKIFWLEGDPDSLKDIKSINEIKDKVKPVLETSLGIKQHPQVKKPT